MELILALALLAIAYPLSPTSLQGERGRARRQLWSHATFVAGAGVLVLAVLRASTALRAISSDFELAALHVALLVLIIGVIALPFRRSVAAVKLLSVHKGVS